ncbi:unnamed protein product [Rotaria sp. Silwood2]|nr:unnamed protein product [Rotaria sp. Silwood2]CAF2518528.1 unnamed protein product [Rotaria sp. Silwood2]CAF2810571.1 unnamed protein product [Rotaria sp. Silwood2]CAF3926284.1 unnamed protein product [Rotaria sp. Silwood2]CAF3980055.1 unnamed protein product [Rotaria sp. Silwood2]
MSKIYHEIVFIFIIHLFQNAICLIRNPAIAILTESNIYIAQISEFNYTNDNFYLIYHHNDSVYNLQSLTSNNFINRIYVCSPSTIYRLDLRIGSTIVPFSPVDDTPCQSSLTYLSGKATLVWALRHAIIQLDFQDMSKEYLWNSTSTINDIIYNSSIIDDNNEFYLSVTRTDHEVAILKCRINNNYRILSFQTCLFIDNGYQDISALAIDGNHLYFADRIEHKIYILTLLPNGFIESKDILPLDTNIIADIQSMFIYNNYLIWLTISGHVRIVSLFTYEVRNIFWFDEQLRSIRLVSFAQWPNHTTTITTTRTTTTATATKITTTIKPSTTTYYSTSITTTSKSANETMNTTITNNYNNSPWKATAYITSIILGIALFLCAALITCVLLNYRLGRVVPHSFTNIFHILRNRTAVPQAPLSEDSLT